MNTPARPSIASCWSLWCIVAIAVATGRAPAQDKRVFDGLNAWLIAHGKGELDLTKERITKSAIGVRAGVVSPESVGETTHLKELGAFCRAVVKSDGATSAEALLEVAAVGLDRAQKLTVEQRPESVRRIGEEQLDALKSPEALGAIETFAKDEAKGARALLIRAAALRALGRRHDEKFFPVIEAALPHKELVVRLGAAEAAQSAEPRALVKPIATALRTETDAELIAAMVDALRKTLVKHKEQVGEDDLRHSVDATLAALGKGDWRSDLAAVEYLAIARSAASVPALIDVLARQVEDAKEAETKESKRAAELRSGMLRQRAWDALVSLTGARFPYDQVDSWQRWWEKIRDEFKVVDAPEGKEKDGVTSTGSSFFGIPVRGSRVLFIVDTSGSMREPMRAGSTVTTGFAGKPKMEAAKHELTAVVEKLTADCAFNMVWFSSQGELWSKDMVEANAKNKKRFATSVADLRADGATNLWEGLRLGLKLESFTNGAQYGQNYDEVFILSDGIPTLGDVRDPKELLGLIRETNRYSRVVINTIYIAGDPENERKGAEFAGMSGAEFMRKIAEENGGRNLTL
ncbi:MAG: VWA domain-containing protein [Planctomycetes bacterium]|nr:VWA domain-containing protein [Planctomycetota bacterium]